MKDLLYQQIARGFGMPTDRIKQAAEMRGGGVCFPSLEHFLGKFCFDVLVDVKLAFEMSQMHLPALKRLAREFDRRKAAIPTELRPYFILYFHTPMGRWCMYAAWSYEGKNGIIWKTTDDPFGGYVLEPWELWFKTVTKTDYTDAENPS